MSKCSHTRWRFIFHSPKYMKEVVRHTDIELMFRTDVAGTEMSSSPQDGLLNKNLGLRSY